MRAFVTIATDPPIANEEKTMLPVHNISLVEYNKFYRAQSTWGVLPSPSPLDIASDDDRSMSFLMSGQMLMMAVENIPGMDSKAKKLPEDIVVRPPQPEAFQRAGPAALYKKGNEFPWTAD